MTRRRRRRRRAQIVEVLARGNRARSLSEKNLEDLKHHGEALWRTLMPPELHGELGRGDTLQLELDEALVAVPWELMFDGAQFLCRRVSIGRIVATRQPRRGDERRTVGTPIRVLVMAADAKGDLPEVRAEGEAIIDELEKHADGEGAAVDGAGPRVRAALPEGLRHRALRRARRLRGGRRRGRAAGRSPTAS